ncbi:hypothetical protein PG990_008167 [Apiospora arundinis]
MSVPIGLSFGDIVAASKILRNVAHAINDQRTIKDDYLSMYQQVNTYIAVLDNLKGFELDERFAQHAQALKALTGQIKKSATDIQTSLAQYQGTLGPNEERQSYAKLKSRAAWAFGVKKKTEQQWDRLCAQSQSLDKLIAGLQLEFVSSTHNLARHTHETTEATSTRSAEAQAVTAIWHADASASLASIGTLVEGVDQRLASLAIAPPQLTNSLSQLQNQTVRIENGQRDMISIVRRTIREEHSHVIAQVKDQLQNAPSHQLKLSSPAVRGTHHGKISRKLPPQFVMDEDIVPSMALCRAILYLLGRLLLGLLPRFLSLEPPSPLSTRIDYYLKDDIFLENPLGRSHRLPVRYFYHWEQVKTYLRVQYPDEFGNMEKPPQMIGSF